MLNPILPRSQTFSTSCLASSSKKLHCVHLVVWQAYDVMGVYILSQSVVLSCRLQLRARVRDVERMGRSHGKGICRTLSSQTDHWWCAWSKSRKYQRFGGRWFRCAEDIITKTQTVWGKHESIRGATTTGQGTLSKRKDCLSETQVRTRLYCTVQAWELVTYWLQWCSMATSFGERVSA